MNLGTLLLASVAFAAGVVCGVFLCEKGVVTIETLEYGGRYVVDTTKSVLNKSGGETVPTTKVT